MTENPTDPTEPVDPPVDPEPEPDTRPNVVVILADDLGPADMSTDLFSGFANGFNETPAIDSMAAEGVVFSNAYSSPSCSPTRMAMLSGISAPRPENNSYQVTPLFGNENDTDIKGIAQGRESGRIHLTDDTITVGHVAKSAGYDTTYIGKFHVAANEAAITEVHGFDANYGGKASGAAEKYPAQRQADGSWAFDDSVGAGLNQFAEPYTAEYVDAHIRPFSGPNTGISAADVDEVIGTAKNVTDAVADATEKALTDAMVSGNPAFVFVGQYVVHDPIGAGQVRRDLRNKYERRAGNRVDANERIGYGGCVENMDQTIARLRLFLQTTPDPRYPDTMMSQTTVVIFKSDNGGRTQLGADNRPFTGQKFETTEGGVRVPMFAWSGSEALVYGISTVDDIVRDVDLLPTLVDLTGGLMPITQPVDGRSFKGALDGGSPVEPVDNVVHLPGWFVNGGRNAVPSTTLRKPNGWKIVYRYANRSWALYNLSTDPGETTNMRDVRTPQAEQFANEMLDWFAEFTPALPTLRQGRATINIDCPAGTRFYRYGQVKVLDARRDIVIRPGDEVPVILRPGFSANRK